jgi:uncharacterized protein (UPF0264 family)
MPKLLVSVRSVEEARAALSGGAHIIDVKEPARGPLGRADVKVWHAVRQAVPAIVPVSVALGELVECERQTLPGPGAWSGIAWRKLGLATIGDGPNTLDRWGTLIRVWAQGPPWIAVAYLDAERAGAPQVEAVIDSSIALGCAGVLFDTWDKARPIPLRSFRALESSLARAREAGLLTALAGGLDADLIKLLRPLSPDIFAVRGAACAQGDRNGPIHPERVATLARAAAE